MITIISFKLGENDKCLIYLTERTIDNINFRVVEKSNIEKREWEREWQTEDIELTISVDNSNLDELYKEKTEDDEDPLPREVDSVRDLLTFAHASLEGNYCYLSGELEIEDGATKAISRYHYDKLFVKRFEEEMFTGSRYTQIKVTLREKVKTWL